MSSKKTTKPKQLDKGVKFLFSIFAVIILFSGTISSNNALSLAENQVTDIVASQGLIATATDVLFDNGIYKVTLDIGHVDHPHQAAEVYLTKNGKLMIVGTAYETDGSVIESIPSRTEFELDGSELSMGDPNAPVTVIEFSDFQCPFCRRFYTATIQDLKTNYIDTGKVYFVYKHFPLSFHPAAQKSAEAVECANEQGKWIEMHDKIYDEQEKQGQGTIQYTTVDIKTWARSIVIDSTEFNTCLDSGKYAEKVSDDMAEGQSVGVSGTPASFVNGILVSGAQPYDSFKTLVDSELSE
jgi:protein-disulfide isomerase